MKSLSTPSFTTRKNKNLCRKEPKRQMKTIFLYSGVTALVEGAQLYSFSNLLYGLSESWRRPAKENRTAFTIFSPVLYKNLELLTLL